jgi:phosphatidylserine/phosphatidylglycerophosphate/cardiolipin synthase-like enzyme
LRGNTMGSVSDSKGDFSLRAYRGDAKTLLAFNFGSENSIKNLAGFTIQSKPKGKDPYYIFNELQFEKPADHAQDPKEPPYSSVNAPIHKFRWVHVPGQSHQGTKPAFGDYTYTVTPRYFDGNQSLKPLDPSLSASVTILVDDFAKGNLSLGFARGYTQSQAFVNHFGPKAKIQPPGRKLQFDTGAVAGTNKGVKYTYKDAYDWLGFTAREKIFAVLNEVVSDKSLTVDVFAYDLNEPDLVGVLLKLGQEQRIRIILDNAALHHLSPPKEGSSSAQKKKKAAKPPKTPLEDLFEKAFAKGVAKNLIKRGKFKRYSHDKVFVVSKKGAHGNTPIKVLTGSTNFSVTGIYVNSNHILIYDDPEVAGWYAGVFEEAWKDDVKQTPFIASQWSQKTFTSTDKKTPKTDITFSPHDESGASKALNGIVSRIVQEDKKKGKGSVLFAVMAIATGNSPVYDKLKAIHSDQEIFSFGISDSPGGTFLFPLGKKTGVLVTGKPVNTQMPAPFNQIPNVIGLGHQIHHKFVVCGFRDDDAVVYCGSSNLALGGEEENGDNLLAIHDSDVATVFAVEALLLVDHFNFLDNSQKPKDTKKASKRDAAKAAHWFLSTTGDWAKKYYDATDLHSVDRELFA